MGKGFKQFIEKIVTVKQIARILERGNKNIQNMLTAWMSNNGTNRCSEFGICSICSELNIPRKNMPKP